MKEFGTEPHRPPFKPIFEWVKRKITNNEKQVKKIAWAIINKIAKEGSPPKAYLRNAIDNLVLVLWPSSIAIRGEYIRITFASELIIVPSLSFSSLSLSLTFSK